MEKYSSQMDQKQIAKTSHNKLGGTLSKGKPDFCFGFQAKTLGVLQ